VGLLEEDESDAQKFGRLVRERRKMRGWNQSDLADEVFGNMDRKNHISEIENGKRPNVTRDTVKNIAEVLEIPPQDIPLSLLWPEALDDLRERALQGPRASEQSPSDSDAVAATARPEVDTLGGMTSGRRSRRLPFAVAGLIVIGATALGWWVINNALSDVDIEVVILDDQVFPYEENGSTIFSRRVDFCHFYYEVRLINHGTSHVHFGDYLVYTNSPFYYLGVVDRRDPILHDIDIVDLRGVNGMLGNELVLAPGGSNLEYFSFAISVDSAREVVERDRLDNFVEVYNVVDIEVRHSGNSGYADQISFLGRFTLSDEAVACVVELSQRNP